MKVAAGAVGPQLQGFKRASLGTCLLHEEREAHVFVACFAPHWAAEPALSWFFSANFQPGPQTTSTFGGFPSNQLTMFEQPSVRFQIKSHNAIQWL